MILAVFNMCERNTFELVNLAWRLELTLILSIQFCKES